MSHSHAGIALPTAISTLNELFAWRVRQTPQGAAYRQFDPGSKQWLTHTWQQIAARVGNWQRAIGALQLAHGARVAILLPNCVEAICVDQAVLALGLVPVPMHALDNPASIGYILNDCETALLVLTTHDQWRAIATCEAMPALKLVVVMDGPSAAPAASATPAAPQLIAMSDWLAAAPQVPPASPARQVRREDLGAIVYTSGTTGKPKGVMLSHHNVMANIRAVLERVDAAADDVFLSFLPLSHTFERTAGYYLPMAAGSCVAYSRSVALLAEDFKSVRPTVLVSVPRIYERFYARLQEQLAAAAPLSRSLFALTLYIGWRRFCRRQRLATDGRMLDTALDGVLWPVLERLVARKVLAQFGGRLRAAVSGGAPLPQAVGQCFLALGLPLLQGYGMTETSPVVAANAVDDNWPATVGRPLSGVQVRIGERDELQVHSDSVMLGYWKRPQDTLAAMTADGWLRTGDQAVIEQGHIRISGRIKEIIVTSTGEKIAPVDLELAILSDPLFEQAMVIGENRPFISSIVVLNRKLWHELASKAGLDADAADSVDAPAARTQLLARLQAATCSFPHYAMPRAVWVAREAWTVENSLITPTLKLKRLNLLARFDTEIAAMYAARRPQAAATA
jgi:long-chain acyl-CoA synthetase